MLSELWSRIQPKTVPPLDLAPDWSQVGDTIRSEVITEAEAYLGFSWPMLFAVRYLDYARNGNRVAYEKDYFLRRQALILLVLAERLEGKGRFLDDVINGIWCLCEESSWVLPAHHNYFYAEKGSCALPRISEQVIDLFAAETGALLPGFPEFITREALLPVRHKFPSAFL